MRNKRRAIALTVLSIMLYFSVIAVVLLLGQKINIRFGGEGSAESTELSIGILLWGALVCFSLWVVMLWAYFSDKATALDGQPVSGLYAPLLATKLSLAMYTTFIALQGIDIITHDLKPHYAPLYQPLVRLFENILLIAVFASLASLMYAIMRGRAWNRLRLIALFVIVFSVAALLAATWIVIAST